jgi:hypothetical protein
MKSLSEKSSWKRVYAVISKKKFKYYTDKNFATLKGCIDFDRINCLIMIDDGEDKKFIEPKKFKIEISGCMKLFVFETESS